MTPRPVALAGIVLAGGTSRRMGRDKATLPVAGGTLVERVVSVVGQRCRPVFVMAAPRQALPELAAVVLPDEVGGAGPLPATGRGLGAAAAAGARWAFVCAVDMPFLNPDLIDSLAGAAAHSPADVVLSYDGRDHYLAAVYATSVAERVDALVAAGERSMRALIATLAVERLEVTDARVLANVNSPADWEAIQGC